MIRSIKKLGDAYSPSTPIACCKSVLESLFDDSGTDRGGDHGWDSSEAHSLKLILYVATQASESDSE